MGKSKGEYRNGFKTKRSGSLKNRFHTFNAADHNFLLSLFIMIDLVHTEV